MQCERTCVEALAVVSVSLGAAAHRGAAQTSELGHSWARGFGATQATLSDAGLGVAVRYDSTTVSCGEFRGTLSGLSAPPGPANRLRGYVSFHAPDNNPSEEWVTAFVAASSGGGGAVLRGGGGRGRSLC